MPDKFVKRGAWRTLEWFWNSPQVIGIFRLPEGAEIKVRYGGGWWFGKDRQRQTLDGLTDKQLSIGAWSMVYARMQIYTKADGNVHYDLLRPGP